MSTEKQLWNVDEVAKFLGISRNTIYWWAEIGKIPHSKLGKLVRFNPDDVMAWLKGKSRGSNQ